jgi:hypothetical protein
MNGVYAVEGNFCGLGVYSVVRDVLAGVQGPEFLWRRLRGVCVAAGPHTDRCVKLFHHCDWCVPREVAVAALDSLCASKNDRGRVGELILRHVAADPTALALVADTEWRKTAHFSCAAAHAVAIRAVAPRLFAKLMVHLPRRLVLGTPLDADTAKDDAALRLIANYRAWLLGRPEPAVAHAHDWRPAVIAACRHGMARNGMAAELIEIVLSFVAHSPGVHSDELPLS